MTEPAPDWAINIPNVPLHELPAGGNQFLRPFTAQQLIQIGLELMEQFLKKVVEAVVGFFLPGAGGAFDQLADWALDNVTATVNNLSTWLQGLVEDIPILEQITDIGTSILTNLLEWVQSIFDSITGGTFTTIGGMIEWANTIWNGFQTFLQNLFGDINATWDDFLEYIYGLLGFDMTHAAIPIVGTGQISWNEPQQLLIDPDFTDQIGFNAGNGWVWDGAQYAGGGSAKFSGVTAGVHQYTSNGVWATLGTDLSASVWVTWTGIAGTVPLRLKLFKWGLVGNWIGEETIGSIDATGTGTWSQISGDYTIGADGTTEVALVCEVDGAYTAGSVNFSNTSLTKPGLLQKNFVQDLVEDWQALFNSLAGKQQAQIEDIENRLGGIASDTGNVNWDWVPDIHSVVDNIVNFLGDLLGQDWGHSDAQSALANQANATLNHAYQIQSIWAAINVMNTPGNVVYIDEFSRDDALGANWSMWDDGAGYWDCDGNNAVWNHEWPNGHVNSMNIWVGGNTTTAYQDIVAVLGSACGIDTLGYSGNGFIYGHVSDDWNNWVRFRWRPYYGAFVLRCAWSIDVNVGGTITDDIATGDLSFNPGQGATILLRCGHKGSTNANYIGVWVNNSEMWSGTYTHTNTGRKGGFGGIAEGVYPSSINQKPPKINYWILQDQE